MRAVVVAALALVAEFTSAAALELIGQAGVLGEWELTADLTATGGKQEFAGPIVLKHTGICSADGPETRTGEMRLQHGERLAGQGNADDRRQPVHV